MNSPVKLDHIGVAIKDLERGRAAYERLGFKLTPRSIHRGSPTPGAPVVPFGSGNHCAMVHEGYLEVVSLIDPTIFSNIKRARGPRHTHRVRAPARARRGVRAAEQ